VSAQLGVLALAGPPAAGKTTLAREMAQLSGARRIGFGDYVRAEAAARGVEPTRTVLQRLGQRLLGELGAEGFCDAALRSAGGVPTGRPLIWDGVRHVSVLAALSSLYADDLRLVFLDAPRAERLRRLGMSELELAIIDQDETESDVDLLRDHADLVLDGLTISAAIPQVTELFDGTS
jgi:AAA domain